MPIPAIALLMAAGASGPTTYTDSFNRADGAIGIADSGQAWTVWGGGGFDVASNEVRQTGTISGDHGTYIDTGSVVRTIEFDVTTAETGNGHGFGIAFRVADSSNWFAFFFYRSAGGSLFWYLQKRVAGSYTTLVNSSVGAITGILKVVDTGSNIKIYIDGGQVGAGGGYNDTSLNTNTKQGIFMTNAGNTWRGDNWSAV